MAAVLLWATMAPAAPMVIVGNNAGPEGPIVTWDLGDGSVVDFFVPDGATIITADSVANGREVVVVANEVFYTELLTEVVFEEDIIVDLGAAGPTDFMRVAPSAPTRTTPCAPGLHTSARGLRLYYDSKSRASRIETPVAPDTGLHLRSDGGNRTTNPSTGVTTPVLDPTAPTASQAKCLDSAPLDLADGNPRQGDRHLEHDLAVEKG
jgi:hypothetical protein